VIIEYVHDLHAQLAVHWERRHDISKLVGRMECVPGGDADVIR
jgi:hypothetical protein